MSKTIEAEEAITKLYELMLIVVPNIGDDKINKELDEIRKLIKDGKGSIVNEDIWGHRDMAYRIKKHDSGYYAVFNFECDGALLPELEKTLKIEANILRFLIIKAPKGYIFKTQTQFEKEAEEMAKNDATKKAPVPAPASAPAPAPAAQPAPKKEVVKPVEKAPAPAPAPAAAEPKKEEESKKTLDELDEKLKSIIDDSDIDL